ncbi:MAG: TetR/AcrR family transcriptional regulator [Oscillospiraceae bacterium]|nr:TetR/AcrR family transcriptional regulator [Oscillospiraceae bacterium]
MANRTPGITEKLMEQSLQEFLTHGYMDASLRTIAENAGTSPRAIYTRYGDKEGLFAALVSEQADTLKALFRHDMETYHAKPVDKQKQLFHGEAFDAEYQEYLHTIIDYIYDNWDAFKLIICGSDGTRFAGFVDEIVEIEEHYTLLYIEHTGNDVIRSGRAAPQLIHLLCSAFVHGFFEFVRHDMPKDAAMTYISQLQTFFACGWDNLFRP